MFQVNYLEYLGKLDKVFIAKIKMMNKVGFKLIDRFCKAKEEVIDNISIFIAP